MKKADCLVYVSVQLRPTVRPMGKALEFDKSLFERLYTGPLFANMTRTMLDVSCLSSPAWSLLSCFSCLMSG